MELVPVNDILDYKILPFNIYLQDGEELFAAGETLTPGKIIQLRDLEFIYTTNPQKESTSSDIKEIDKNDNEQIFSDIVSRNREKKVQETPKNNNALDFTPKQNINHKEQPSQQQNLIQEQSQNSFITNPLNTQNTVVESFDMGMNFSIPQENKMTIDSIDVSKYKGPVNKVSKINPESQIKIKAFYNKTINMMRTAANADMNVMFSHVRDKIVQDIVYELHDVEYCSQIKLLGEFSKCHSLNTAILSGFIARRMGISESEILDIVLAGLLHDIGKVQFSQDILNKKALTNEEKALLRRHTIIGYKMIKNEFKLGENIARVALEHHECNDGSGYPASKSGDFICKECQIISVANYFDRISSNRTQNKVDNIKESLKIMLQMGSEKFAPEPLYTFVYMFNFNDTMSFEQMLL